MQQLSFICPNKKDEKQVEGCKDVNNSKGYEPTNKKNVQKATHFLTCLIALRNK